MSDQLQSTERPVTTPDRRTFVKALAGAATCLAGLAIASKTVAVTTRRRIEVSADTRESSSGDLVPQPQVPSIYWTWGEIKRGDCTISPGATFYLYANGSTRWVCDLRSSDSGDEWDGRFEIKNANGQVLAATPAYHFDISNDNVTKHWDESRGPNASLAAAFPAASTINYICSC